MKPKSITAAIAILIAIICALSFKVDNKRYANFYGISASNATGYVVAEEVNGEVENIDYACWSPRTTPCIVSAAGFYSSGQTIPFLFATIVVDRKEFEDLNPTQ